jgi:hypothetical protein
VSGVADGDCGGVDHAAIVVSAPTVSVLPGPLGESWANLPRPVILPLPRSYPDRDGFGGSYPSDHTPDPGVNNDSDYALALSLSQKEGFEGEPAQRGTQGRQDRGQGGIYSPLAPHQYPTAPAVQYVYDAHEHGDDRVPHQPPPAPAPASRYEGQGGVGMQGAGAQGVQGRGQGNVYHPLVPPQPSVAPAVQHLHGARGDGNVDDSSA